MAPAAIDLPGSDLPEPFQRVRQSVFDVVDRSTLPAVAEVGKALCIGGKDASGDKLLPEHGRLVSEHRSLEALAPGECEWRLAERSLQALCFSHFSHRDVENRGRSVRDAVGVVCPLLETAAGIDS